MSAVVFSDSIENNLEILRELLRGLPPGVRNQAKFSASTVERAIEAIKKDTQGNQGAALGAAFAIYMYAQRFVESSQSGGPSEAQNLIQLLS